MGFEELKCTFLLPIFNLYSTLLRIPGTIWLQFDLKIFHLFFIFSQDQDLFPEASSLLFFPVILINSESRPSRITSK
jgi:hypothetical protein